MLELLVLSLNWINSVVCRNYIENHLNKCLPERSSDNPMLVLYDGHKFRINLGLIDGAKTQNLILLSCLHILFMCSSP